MEAAESSSKRQKLGTTSVSRPDMTEMFRVIAKTTNSPWLAFNLLRMSFVQFAPIVNQNFSLTDGDKELLNCWLRQLPDYQSKYEDRFGYYYQHAATKDAPFVFRLMLLLDQQEIDVPFLWRCCFERDSAKVLAILLSRFPPPNEIAYSNSFSLPTKCAKLLGGEEEIWKYINKKRFKRDTWAQLCNYLEHPQNGFSLAICNRLKQDLQPYTFADLKLHLLHKIRFTATDNPRAVETKTNWIKELIPPEWAEDTVETVLHNSLRFPDIDGRVVTATTLCKIFDLDPNLVSRGMMDNDDCRPIAQLHVDGCITPDSRPLSRSAVLHLAEFEKERFSWADIFNLDPVNHQQVVMVFLTYRKVPSDAETRAKILQLVLREDPFVIGTEWVTTYSSLALLRNLKRLGYNLTAFGESADMQTFWKKRSYRMADWIRVVFLEDTSQSSIQNKRNAQAWFVSYINSHYLDIISPDYHEDLCKQLRVVYGGQEKRYWAKRLNKNKVQVIGQTRVYPFFPLELVGDND